MTQYHFEKGDKVFYYDERSESIKVGTILSCIMDDNYGYWNVETDEWHPACNRYVDYEMYRSEISYVKSEVVRNMITEVKKDLESNKKYEQVLLNRLMNLEKMENE